jgi:hypothetical protein
VLSLDYQGVIPFCDDLVKLERKTIPSSNDIPVSKPKQRPLYNTVGSSLKANQEKLPEEKLFQTEAEREANLDFLASTVLDCDLKNLSRETLRKTLDDSPEFTLKTQSRFQTTQKRFLKLSVPPSVWEYVSTDEEAIQRFVSDLEEVDEETGEQLDFKHAIKTIILNNDVLEEKEKESVISDLAELKRESLFDFIDSLLKKDKNYLQYSSGPTDTLTTKERFASEYAVYIENYGYIDYSEFKKSTSVISEEEYSEAWLVWSREEGLYRYSSGISRPQKVNIINAYRRGNPYTDEQYRNFLIKRVKQLRIIGNDKETIDRCFTPVVDFPFEEIWSETEAYEAYSRKHYIQCLIWNPSYKHILSNGYMLKRNKSKLSELNQSLARKLYSENKGYSVKDYQKKFEAVTGFEYSERRIKQILEKENIQLRGKSGLLIAEWKKKNPTGTQKECANALGKSIRTIKTYWNQEGAKKGNTIE